MKVYWKSYLRNHELRYSVLYLEIRVFLYCSIFLKVAAP